jgi:hypothetical protein
MSSNFQVEIEEKKVAYRPGVCANLGITNNGFQWMVFSDMTFDELSQVEEAIHNFLAARQNQPGENVTA